ncbi:hypothetical protein GOP47_0028704 [Adiantum capillus-veneris]|nr:hypothetical protein GOP47_0028704 [Adiantum capillus-veneris]
MAMTSSSYKLFKELTPDVAAMGLSCKQRPKVSRERLRYSSLDRRERERLKNSRDYSFLFNSDEDEDSGDKLKAKNAIDYASTRTDKVKRPPMSSDHKLPKKIKSQPTTENKSLKAFERLKEKVTISGAVKKSSTEAKKNSNANVKKGKPIKAYPHDNSQLGEDDDGPDVPIWAMISPSRTSYDYGDDDDGDEHNVSNGLGDGMQNMVSSFHDFQDQEEQPSAKIACDKDRRKEKQEEEEPCIHINIKRRRKC